MWFSQKAMAGPAPTENVLRFQMRGSQGDLYEVTAERRGDALVMKCSCQAADYGLHCHHRLELLHGDVSALESDNIGDVKKLGSMLAGTELELALRAFDQAEEAQLAAKVARRRCQIAVDKLLKGQSAPMYVEPFP